MEHAETIAFPEFVVTSDQKEALWRKWRRDNNALSFQEFVNTVQPTFGMDGAIVVQWCGMWLAIETGGHIHS